MVGEVEEIVEDSVVAVVDADKEVMEVEAEAEVVSKAEVESVAEVKSVIERESVAEVNSVAVSVSLPELEVRSA